MDPESSQLSLKTCVLYVPEYRRSPTYTALNKSRRKIEIITFFRRAPYFSSKEWKHFETVMAEEYCWAMRPIRFPGVGDGISVWLASLYRRSSPYMNTHFRLALVLPERNCCLSRGVPVAYIFTHNLSPALRVWFCAATWTSDCNLWGTCKLNEFYATLGLCASCTVSTALTDSKKRS